MHDEDNFEPMDIVDDDDALLRELDSIKAERNIPTSFKSTAEVLVAKYAPEIRAIHKAGRAQFEVYLLIEKREGHLQHAEDTLRKAVNRLIPDWRKKPSGKAAKVSKDSASGFPASPFADQINQGGEQW